MRPGRLLPFLVVLATALPSLVYLIDPAARDQGVFAYIGWRWLEGGIPYLGAGMEHKGPLPFLAYALSFVLFGRSILAARLLAWIALLVAGWGIVVLVQALAPGPSRRQGVAALAGSLYVAIAGLGGLSTWWSGAQAETFMEPLVVWALVAALPRQPGLGGAWDPLGRRSTRLFLAGAGLGLAALGKPTVLLIVPVILWAAGGPARRAVPSLLAGIAVPPLLTFGWFLVRGAAPALWGSLIEANLDYGGRGLSRLLARLRYFLPIHHGFIDLRFLVPAAIGGAALARRLPAAGSRLVLGWTAAAYLEVLVQGRFFGYHFYPVVGPLSVLAAFGIWAVLESEPGPRPASSALRGGKGPRPWFRGAIFFVLLVVVISALASLPWDDWSRRWSAVTGRTPRAVFLRSLGKTEHDVDPLETLEAAGWAEAHLRPEETLLVWGFEPAVNFLARRRSPTRFIYDYFLTSNAIRPARRARNWDLFWSDVAATPPDWIAVVHNDVNPLERDDSATQLRKEPRLKTWVEENYTPEARIGDFEFLKRRKE